MEFDRRGTGRAGLTRRGVHRTPTWKRVLWRRADGGGESRSGMLVSASENGLGLLMPPEEAPELGAQVRLGSARRPWMRGAVVVRRADLSVTTTLVGLVFEAGDRGTGGEH